MSMAVGAVGRLKQYAEGRKQDSAMKRTVCIAAFGTRLGISGGINVYTRDLVQALADHGRRHNYAVLVTGSADAWTFRTWPAHIRFVLLKDNPQWLNHLYHIRWRVRRALTNDHSDLVSYLEVQALQRIIDAEDIDLIHYPKTVINPSHMSVRVPLVLTFFDMQQEYFPEFFTARELEYRKKAYRPSVDRADSVVAPSGFTASSLRERYNIPGDKIVNIPVGIPPGFPDITYRIIIYFIRPIPGCTRITQG
jgi:glycosyltransferase involved in cell wall biosynthesis